MRISVSADELTGVAERLPDALRRRGHEPILHAAYVDGERDDWAWGSESAATLNAVDRCVSYLRRKLGEPPLIETVRGVGFVLGR